MRKRLGWFLGILCVIGCTQTPVKRYHDLLDPKVEAHAPRAELDHILGKPANCKRESPYQRCEYRTALGRTTPTPIVFKKSPTMKVDVSPYQHFDVIHLYFNADGHLKKWEPISVQP